MAKLLSHMHVKSIIPELHRMYGAPAIPCCLEPYDVNIYSEMVCDKRIKFTKLHSNPLHTS